MAAASEVVAGGREGAPHSISDARGDDDLAVDDFAVLVHRSNREVEISVGKNRGEANLSILGYQHSIVVNVERRTGSPSLSS